MGEKFLRIGIALTAGALTARYLGPERFGRLSYVIAAVTILSSIARLGLDGIVVRDISHTPTSAHTILGSALVLKACAGVALWGVGVGAIWLSRPGDMELLTLAGIIGSTLLFQASDTVDLWFQSQFQSKRTVTIKGATAMTSAAIKVALVVLTAPLVGFGCVAAFDGLLAGTGMYVAYRRFRTEQRWFYSIKVAVGLLRQSWPFLVSAIGTGIFMRIDQIMLANLSSSTANGVFSSAVPISEALTMLPAVTYPSFLPYCAKKRAESNYEYLSTLANIFAWFTWVSLLLCVLIAVASQFIISHLYGPQFQQAGSVLRILVFTNVFIALGVVQSIWVMCEGRGILSIVQCGTSAAVSVLLNFVLIPRYGAIGAAICAVIAQFTAGVGVNAFFSRNIFLLQVLSPVVGPKRAMRCAKIID